MTRRLAALTPFVLAAVVLTSATTLTFAAVNRAKPATPPAAPRAKAPKTMVVPDVRGQAYVFAKGILEDAGFAWNVAGSVQGFAVNTVVGQKPAAGTFVVDNGLPTVVLTLARNSNYREVGTPENFSPYEGSGIELPAQSKPVVVPAKKAAPLGLQAPTASRQSPAAPAAAKKAVQSEFRGGKLPAFRQPAFAAPGAPAEPQNEMPLPDRARMLSAWVEKHPHRTAALEKHWLYQHAWLVYGAKFGWWHGAEALKTLIRVDQRVEQLWGTGATSEAEARAALAYVDQRSR